MVVLTLGTAAIYPSIGQMLVTVALTLKIRSISKNRNGLFASLNFRQELDNTDSELQQHYNTRVDLRELEDIVAKGKLFAANNNKNNSDVKIEITECCSPEPSRNTNRLTSQVPATPNVIPRKSKSEEFLSRLMQTFNEFPLIDETPTNSPIKSLQCKMSDSLSHVNRPERECQKDDRCSSEGTIFQTCSTIPDSKPKNIRTPFIEPKINFSITQKFIADPGLSLDSNKAVLQDKCTLGIPQSQNSSFEKQQSESESPRHTDNRTNITTQAPCAGRSLSRPHVFVRSKSSFIIRVPPPDSVLLSPTSAILKETSTNKLSAVPLPTISESLGPSAPLSPKFPRAPPPSPRLMRGVVSIRRLSLQTETSRHQQRPARAIGRSVPGSIVRTNSRTSLVAAIGSIGSSTGSLALSCAFDSRANLPQLQKRASELGTCFVYN